MTNRQIKHKTALEIMLRKSSIILLTFLLVIVSFFPILEAYADTSNNITVDYFKDKKIGVSGGSANETLALTIFDQKNLEIFTSFADIPVALDAKKIDAMVCDSYLEYSFKKKFDNFGFVEESLGQKEAGIMLSKQNPNTKLQKELNEFISNSETNGFNEELDSKWLSDNFADQDNFTYNFTGQNGTLNIATCSEYEPMVFMKDGQIVGRDIDFIYRFCNDYGYKPNLQNMTISSFIFSVNSGKSDLGIECLGITPERLESCIFTNPYFKFTGKLCYNKEMVRAALGNNQADDSQNENEGIFEQIATSFNKTFITEARYEMILNGFATTLVITFFSLIFGTILGFIIALRYRCPKWVNKIASAYIAFFQGTPVLVVLLIFYYLIFGNVNINAVIVAIIVFSLNISSYIAELIRSGILSVDPGQREAALSLGYSEFTTFRKFILQLAAKNFFPNYRGQVISLLKSTSIVGYIAICDLTKAGDIIRSRTYEAFFPLISIAIIYLLLAWLITLFLSYLEKRLDHKHQSINNTNQTTNED